MSKTFIDYDTGEIIEKVTGYTTEDSESKKTAYRQLQLKRKHLRELIEHHCGEFYFYRYDKLLEQLQDDTATAFRFLYLCACADKDGYIYKYGREKCRTIEDFTNVFEKTKDTVRRYMETLISNQLIFKDAAGYRLNPLFYSMGNLDDEFKRNTIRTFNKAIKELYYDSDPKEHKMIGKVLKLVPYINVYNNVLCWNIYETNKELIQPLTLSEIRTIIHSKNNYGYDIIDKLEKLFIKGEPVIGNFTSVGEEHYIINPRLFYRGNNSKDLQSIIDQFDISKYQYLNKHKRKIAKGEN